MTPARNTDQFTIREIKTSTRIQPARHRQDPAAAPSSASSTKAFLPRGIGQSGTVNLERSAAGAIFDGGPTSQSAHYAGKGWTPIPPSPASISQFVRPHRSPKANMGKLRGRLLSEATPATPAATSSVVTTCTSKVRPGAELSSVVWNRRNDTRSRYQHKKFSSGRVERGRGIFIGGLGMSPLSQSQVGRRQFKKQKK